MAELPYSTDRMTLDDMAREVDLLKDAEDVVKSRREALEEELRQKIRDGGHCALKRLESVKGRQSWPEELHGAVLAAFGSLGVDVRQSKPVTPNQALERVKKAKPDMLPTAKAMVDRMAKHPNSFKLIDAEDSIVGRAFHNSQPNKD